LSAHTLNLISSPNDPPPPRKNIRVLLLEDRASDAELIVRELRRCNFEPCWDRAETEEQFIGLLDPSVDVILADYNLPKFDGLTALKKLQELKLDIPFIIISGSLGDELVAQCIKQGVTDYLMKDRLERLGLAVSNALDEHRLRGERVLVEEQLRQAQKMEAIGQLAGGIAHDFNNVLTVINGWSGMLLNDKGVSEFTREAAKQIYTAGQRASSLTRQLLYFSRKRPIERISFDLNQTIEEIASMLRRLIGEHINLTLDLAKGLPPIEADISMMEQVLVNLTVNARDAMPDGGRLTLQTKAIELTEADVRGREDLRPGCFVSLRVQDTGCGIPPEILTRVFEPFFTTKEVGKGTGLGLATVFGIVKQHHGWLEIDSTVGEGTCLTMTLPISEAKETVPVRSNAVEGPVSGGSETILIVEDEASVREFAVAVLKPLGYRILQARSGLDALEVWKWHSSRIRLLLTDMVMPDDLTGPELADKLVAEKPGLAVIFTSGYSQETMGSVFAPAKARRFIHKPYSPRQLSTVVREVLDTGKVNGNARVLASS
jgi:two-component system cell cycle sensor histidine kinase/response regulator CckA